MQEEEKMERVLAMKAEIQALEFHLDYLKNTKAASIDIAETKIKMNNYIRELDKLMGLPTDVI